jgi:hypothetical protein
MITVMVKLIIVRSSEGASVFLITASRRPAPLSKRIIIRVIVVKTWPSPPKKSLVITPLIGPMIIPIIRRRSTFGIFVLSKSSLKRCEKNISRPSAIIIKKVSMA